MLLMTLKNQKKLMQILFVENVFLAEIRYFYLYLLQFSL